MDGTFNENDITRVVEADKAHVWHHLIQHKPFETTDPRIILEGKGMRVWDQNGKEYLDAVSGGVWTVNVGYGRESIANAVRDQLIKLNYFAGSAGSIPGALFAEKLISKMPGMKRVYQTNSGTEANEKAQQAQKSFEQELASIRARLDAEEKARARAEWELTTLEEARPGRKLMTPGGRPASSISFIK